MVARTFKWKLTLSYLILILFFMLIVSVAVIHSIDEFYMDNLRQHLFYEARLIEELAGKYDFTRPSPELNSMAARASSDTRGRITVVAADGTVLADTEENVRAMGNHGERPEIRSALNGKAQSVVRYSSTLRTDMIYVATPVAQNDQVVGAVRISLPLVAINSLLHRLWLVVFAIMALAGVLSAFLSLGLVNKLTRPLADVTEVARSMAAGNLKRRVHYDGQDEIGIVVGAINSMAQSLDEKLSEISEIKTRLETVLEHTVNGIMLVNPSHRVLFINPAARRLLGAEESEIIGKRHIEVTGSYALTEAIDLVFKQGQNIKKEFMLHNIGSRAIEINIVPIDDECGTQAVLVVLNDITEQKRLETVRQDFVANVSHELKTPVAAISGFAETLIVENPENQTVQEFSRIIYDEAQRLARLVNSLLELSRLESIAPDLKLADFELEECVQSSLERFGSQLTEKNLNVILEFPGTSIMVKADRDRIMQVLINLLDNAVKHSKAGSVIKIGAEERLYDVLVKVTDHGLGIPPGETERIFERFYRVDRARTRKDGGTGLGLSIVKHIVEAHGGHVGVKSQPGRGATFLFTLPKK